MRTQTLFECVQNEQKQFGTKTTVPIVDLYCGVGGFSTGARAAGHHVELAIDCWPAAIRWHSANHTKTDHHCLKLPHPVLESLVPPPRTRWHLHGSPPCQLLSKAYNTESHSQRWDEGLENIRFYLKFAMEREPASFTMEQVATPVVLRLMEEYKTNFPEFVDFMIVKMEEFKVPQARHRVIAGSPWLIQRLRDTRDPFGRVRARNLCPTQPATAVGIKGSTGTKGKKHLKRATSTTPVFKTPSNVVDMDRRQKRGGLGMPAPTVIGGNKLRWTGPSGKTIRYLTLREHATFQTFPTNYAFPEDGKDAQLLCGNSVPPLFAQHLMSNYRLPIERNDFPNAVFPPRAPSPSLSIM